MNKDELKHLPTYDGLRSDSDPELKVVERAEVTFKDRAQYLIYVIGLREYSSGNWDIIHSISSRNELGHRGLKFCPLEDVVKYEALQRNR